ncbi:hypothetical protein Bca52824_031846 [Brassica carinata]|uniref:non-specific serine/threonine protein kinase n=1 Tax=Brassica carinata TaxID=52824 RepID=A0A8X7V4L0_BRACI|nr:hypothetical protein Bca52824_031846 [Brassica carinata]
MSISILLITIVFFVVGLPLCFSADQQYEKCLSPPLPCGHGPSVFQNNITYPFWGNDIDKPDYCGQPPFELTCDDYYQTLTLEIANLTLRVVSAKLEDDTITVADESLLEDDGCPTTWDFNGDGQFTLNHNTEKMDLHTCSSDMSTSLPYITCKRSDGSMTTYRFLPSNVSDRGCVKAGEVPVLESSKTALHQSKKTLEEALKGGFELRYIIDDRVCRDCTDSDGVCGSDSRSGKFRCLCADRPHKSSCKDKATQTFSLHPKFEACEPKSCGKGPKISFPFYLSGKQESFCGYPSFELTCDDDQELPVLGIAGENYIIKNMSYEKQWLQVVNSRVSHDPCPSPMHNLTLYRTPFSVSPSNINFSILYDCSDNLRKDLTTDRLTCSGNSSLRSFGVFQREIMVKEDLVASGSCQKQVDVPVSASGESDVNLLLRMSYVEILERGFVLNWTAHSCVRCNSSGGRCGTDDKEFVCLCPDGPNIHNTCRKGGGAINWKLKIVISVVAGVVGLTAASICWFVYHRRKTKSYRTSSTFLPRNISSEPSSKSSDVVEKAEELLVGVRLFSYDELVEATGNFDPSKELGDGGFGTVYYGKLKDGRSVAVKRLYDNNFKRAEQFRNEVEILTGLRHPNLVSLFGCSSKQSRELLLVYEYVANGTLADHLNGPQANPSSLPWSTRLKIAVETASALKYLHASKIIHRDVKSNNILLDQNFNVKVADFGLSRLFPMDKTHVSTAPQGTPGYVDPDYHLCYQLSKKSDVYSFAVVLMELISSLPAVDITRTRQEINLSNMAVVKIQSHKLHEMVDPSLGFDTDTRVRETVIAVAELAFQCLQSDKDLRPCMSHVMETLTKIQNNGFGSNMDDDSNGDKSGPLVVQSPNSVMVKWDSK